MSERHSGLVELMGIEERVEAPGIVHCWLTVDERHRNIQGVVHGSVAMATLDTAMGHALDSMLESTEFCSTTQISFQFLRGVWPGDRIEAVGTVTQKGRRIAYLDGTCRNQDGVVVARAQGTWYVGTKKSEVSP